MIGVTASHGYSSGFCKQHKDGGWLTKSDDDSAKSCGRARMGSHPLPPDARLNVCSDSHEGRRGTSPRPFVTCTRGGATLRISSTGSGRNNLWDLQQGCGDMTSQMSGSGWSQLSKGHGRVAPSLEGRVRKSKTFHGQNQEAGILCA
jgi:hypothetical protein